MDNTNTFVAIVGMLLSFTAIGITLVWKVAGFFSQKADKLDLDKLEDRVTAIEIGLATQGVLIENIDKNVDKLVRKLDL